MRIELKILNEDLYRADIETIQENEHCTYEEAMILQKTSVGNLPAYATTGSAAVDLICPEDITLSPGQVLPIHTGLAIWVGSTRNDWLGNEDNDFTVAALILPRSGRGAKEGLVIANTVALIDEDYQGELIVYAMNDNKAREREDYNDTILIKKGERFAQMTFIPVIKAEWQIVSEFSNETDRGKGGFGHTGV